jgi:hypothetical protein
MPAKKVKNTISKGTKKKVSTECGRDCKCGGKCKGTSTECKCKEKDVNKKMIKDSDVKKTPGRRGRKPGSKNKISTECSNKILTESKEGKKRGRPRKEKVQVKEEIDTSNLKTLKHLGYCSEEGCSCSITNGDFVAGKKTLLRCIRCGKRQRITQLLKEDPSKEPSYKSKKEFLNDITSVSENIVESKNTIDVPDDFKDYAVEDKNWDY